MNPPIFGFPEGLGNSSFSTTPVVDVVGAYSLPETSVTQVTLTQPLTHSSPLAPESGNIPASFFPHMHTPSALLGHPIGQMASSQVVHTTMVTQATQPPSHTSHISTPYIGGQSSMGGQPSAGGKPSAAGKLFTGGKPTWLQHQPAWGKTTPASPSIPTTIGLYPGHPYPGVVNPLWTQPNPTGIPPQGTMPYQSVNSMIQMQQSLPPPYIGGPTGQPQYVGGPPVQSQYMGGQTGQPPYIGGQPGQPPYMGGPSSFVTSPQPGYGPTGVPTQYSYHQYQQPNRQLPFLATLDLPDLSRLTNDPILHAPFWPTIPAKLPSDIPKFDGKPGEDPNNHVMTFHLWCSSNSLMDDSIRLRLFQRTLTGAATKWYIELSRNSFVDFNSLAMDFLTHFQLPIWYETGTNF
jgi:hypothetical protein